MFEQLGPDYILHGFWQHFWASFIPANPQAVCLCHMPAGWKLPSHQISYLAKTWAILSIKARSWQDTLTRWYYQDNCVISQRWSQDLMLCTSIFGNPWKLSEQLWDSSLLFGSHWNVFGMIWKSLGGVCGERVLPDISYIGMCPRCKENHFYSLPFGQAEASTH